MKKLILILILLVSIVGCRDSNEPKVNVTWTLQVDYLDNVRDTIIIETNSVDYKPELKAYDDISKIELGWDTKAAYVKTFKVLDKQIEYER
jgi:hypothetical protein